MRTLLAFLFSCTLGSYTISVLLAQETGGLTIEVFDPQNAAVASADVKLEASTSGTPLVARTDGAGKVRFPALLPGTYRVTVSVIGFQTYRQESLRVYARDLRNLRVNLQLAGTSSSVTVVAEAEGITLDASSGSALSGNYIQELPVNTRSLQALVATAPGVTQSSGPMGGLNVNGLRANTNYYMIDGVSANSGITPAPMAAMSGSGSSVSSNAVGNTMSLASFDAIQEVRVQTSTFAPEFGRSPGAQISVLTRGGGRDFHGSAYTYLRNERFGANDWFSNRDGLQRPASRLLNSGGMFSGPVRKESTFFLASVEALLLRQPTTVVETVPSVYARQNAGVALRPYLNAFPVPNGANLTRDTARFSSSFATPASAYSGSVRVDHRRSDRLSGFARYSYAPSEAESRGGFTSSSTLQKRDNTTQSFTASATWFAFDDSLNDFRFNYTRSSATLRADADGFAGATPLPDALIFPNGINSSNGAFNMQITGEGTLARGQWARNSQDQINAIFNQTVNDDGGHSIKVGVDYRLLLPTYENKNYGASLIFNGWNNGEGSLLSGSATTALINYREQAVYPRLQNLSLFLQDTYQANRRLSLTYGVRWDLNPAPTTRSGPKPLGLDDAYSLTDDRPLYNTNWLNLAPRFGFAYQMNEDSNKPLVLRGGYGWFFDVGYGSTQNAFESAPFASTSIITTPDFPLSAANLAPPTFPAERPYGIAVAGDPQLKAPVVRQLNLTLEKGLGRGQVLSVAYVSTAGRRLLNQQTYPGFFSNDYNLLQITTNGANSDYRGLQVQWRRSLTQSLQFQANYTWGHAIDTSSSDAGGAGLAFLQGNERGSSNFDLRHNLNWNGSWRFPTVRKSVLSFVTDGWFADWFVNARTGFPFDVRILNTTTGNTTGNRGFFAQGRVDYVGGPVWVSDAQAPGGKRLNRAAFAEPAENTQGNLGRNSIRGFGFSQVDLALRRQFRLGEGRFVQLRLEAFNALNSPAFADLSPNEGANLASSNFGLATRMQYSTTGMMNVNQASGAPRSMQVSLRMQF